MFFTSVRIVLVISTSSFFPIISNLFDQDSISIDPRFGVKIQQIETPKKNEFHLKECYLNNSSIETH